MGACQSSESNSANADEIAKAVVKQMKQEQGLGSSASATRYSVTIRNLSGSGKVVGIWNNDPDEVTGDGFTLVWQTQGVANEDSISFAWLLDWTVSFVTTFDTVAKGTPITIHTNGHDIAVDPSGVQNNGANLTYDKEIKAWSMSSADLANVAQGLVGVQADHTFTNKMVNDENFYVALKMNGKNVFLSKGNPSSLLKMKTKPTYYLSTIFNTANDVVTAEATTTATSVSLDGATTHRDYYIDGTNTIREGKGPQ